MKKELKEKDFIIFNFIKGYIYDNGYPPSIREICSKLGFKSTSTVFNSLNRLEENTYIRRDSSKTRAIEIIHSKDINDEKQSFETEIVHLPLIGRIAAGEPILASQNIEEYVPIPSFLVTGNNFFILKVKGDSMIEAGIMDSDLIIVDPSNISPPNGKIVVAQIDNELATVKRLERKKEKIILKPENRLYSPMIFDSNQVTILGCVTGLYRKI